MVEGAVAAARRKQAEVVSKGAREEEEETEVWTKNLGRVLGDVVQRDFDNTRGKQSSKRKLKEWPSRQLQLLHMPTKHEIESCLRTPHAYPLDKLAPASTHQ